MRLFATTDTIVDRSKRTSSTRVNKQYKQMKRCL